MGSKGIVFGVLCIGNAKEVSGVFDHHVLKAAAGSKTPAEIPGVEIGIRTTIRHRFEAAIAAARCESNLDLANTRKALALKGYETQPSHYCLAVQRADD